MHTARLGGCLDSHVSGKIRLSQTIHSNRARLRLRWWEQPTQGSAIGGALPGGDLKQYENLLKVDYHQVFITIILKNVGNNMLLSANILCWSEF